jgi:hypothetical protein
MPEENLTPSVEDNASPEIVVDSGAENIVDKTATSAEVTWYKGLGKDFESNPSITKFKDVQGLAKSYLEAQKLIGKDKVVVPTEKSTPEEWNAFYKKIGAPEDVAGYETPELEVPQEVRMNDDALNAFKGKAKELGLSKKQFSELYKLQQELNLNQFNQSVEEVKNIKANSETSLRKEWGAAYDVKIDGAQKLVSSFFKGDELHPAFKVLANDKGFVKAMANIAEKLGESGFEGGEKRVTMTPNEAQGELNQIMADFKGAYYNDLDPRHKVTVDRVLELQTMASA